MPNDIIELIEKQAWDSHVINTENPHVVTAEQINAFPYTDARSADFDMTAILQGGVHQGLYKVNQDTLGTPYKQGITSYSVSLILSYANSTTYGFQLAFIQGGTNPIAYRRFADGVLSDWTFSFLPTTGGTLTGNLFINKDSAPQIKLTNLSSSRMGYIMEGNDNYLSIINKKDDNNQQSLYIKQESDSINEAVRIGRKVNGTTNYYNIYGTHNITKGTTDLTAGSSELATNAIYLVYEIRW